MSDPAKLRVGIVATDPLRSVGLLTILEGTPGIELCLIEPLSAFAREDLTAVLLDLKGGLQAVTKTILDLLGERPGLKIVVMGTELDQDHVQSVIAAGAKGYLTETASEGEIKMALEVVLDGSIWAPRKVLARLIEVGRSPEGNPTSVNVSSAMTPRERDVLQLLMAGRSNRDIAGALGIDEVTVKAHLGRMLRKTNSSNRVELTLRAIEEQGRRRTNSH